MTFDFSEFKKVSDSTLEWLKKEYAGVRTGRATPSILDGISVKAYGSSMPIDQLATVSLEDPKTLRITPWDKEVSKDIDKSIRESNLGLSVSLDTEGLRVSFPELTGDRRSLLLKVVKEKLEEARITIRAEREKIQSSIDKQEKSGTISEDDKFRLRADLQKLVDDVNSKFEELSRKKEELILE